MTNARNYFGYNDFNKLFTNVQDSLDPIIPKGTVYAKPALVPKVPKDVDTAYLNNFSAGSTATSPIVPQKGNGSNNWAV
ncbi:hypothetical protein ACPXBC_29115, partial [Escherichia coli]|uniref:hypothetical protein n=1 Tax=Escherichia coli TaxID=562 RepID=UPI003CE539FB